MIVPGLCSPDLTATRCWQGVPTPVPELTDLLRKKSWILKFDDPQALATIDAVFVTVEPNGGSHYPRGKQSLFAYLRSFRIIVAGATDSASPC